MPVDDPSNAGVIRYIGCYVDDSRDRSMPFVLDLPEDERNASSCSNAAARRGRRYFSLQAGGECRIGNDLVAATKHGITPTTAATPDACGALRNGFPIGRPWTMAVYESSQQFVDASDAGPSWYVHRRSHANQ